MTLRISAADSPISPSAVAGFRKSLRPRAVAASWLKPVSMAHTPEGPRISQTKESIGIGPSCAWPPMKFADALRSCSAYLMAYTSCTGGIFCLLLCWSATRPLIFHSLYLQALFLDDLRPLADLVRNEGPGLGTAAAHHIEAIALEHLAQRRALHGFQRRRVQSIDHCYQRSSRCGQHEPVQGIEAG